MATLLLVWNFLVSPLAIPFWGGITALGLHLFSVWRDSKKLSLEKRQQDREDFRVIKDSLRDDLDHVKSVQVETTRQLEEAKEETEKCEKRYFELATQYRELLKYCAGLAREFREMKATLQIHVFKEEQHEQNAANPTTTGFAESVSRPGSDKEVI